MRPRWLVPALILVPTAGLVAVAYRPSAVQEELENRLPRPAPYVTAEARVFPPPYEEAWEGPLNPGRCATCHAQIFAEWNGSMMSNAWRDPGWRAAFLLVARQTSTAGDCEVPAPPDGTARSRLNPFAGPGCSSVFDTDTGRSVISRPGSLLDGFCSQCHMPADFVDNVPLATVGPDPVSGVEHGKLDPEFNPTSDNGTGVAFAAMDSRFRNTRAGQRGIFCAVCHTFADTREMPYGNFHRSGQPYPAAVGTLSRARLLPAASQDRPQVPDPAAPNQGYAIGAGSFRLSPHAISLSEFLGPLTANPPKQERDDYLSGVFKADVPAQQLARSGHAGFYQALHERSEMCAACHDVTNPLPIKNALGRWVGGFPIERTYTEWAGSRYADRPGNRSFDPRFKRDCQTCHMQQDFGQPGTAQTLYADGRPVPPRSGRLAEDGPERPVTFSHHFIGGNTFVPRLIGADVDGSGTVQPYPELSVFSFTSADEKSLYHNAYWTNVDARGPATQHARLAWDRLRNVLDLRVAAPSAIAGGRLPLRITVTNSGSGHNFPTGFPEGRVAWLAVRAFDLGSGRELDLYDARWRRTSKGVGYLTRQEMADPNFPRCREWKLPAGSPDPFAVQFKAIASLGDGCPTLDLPYATPLNLEVDANGLPVDQSGRAIDRGNPRGLPRFRDRDGDGDLFDDSFLSDTRLRPLPHREATALVDRYSVIVPADATGPVAVVAAVYYQSFEAVVAKKFLGNLADLDTDFKLEPCVLGGACDGRSPAAEPAVVEGAPPVPMEVRTLVIGRPGGAADTVPPAARPFPAAGASGVAPDVVVKATFSEPVQDLDPSAFTLTDERGEPVPAFVDAIGDGTWALFPHQVFLAANRTYTARLAAGVCDSQGNCTRREIAWSFTTGEVPGEGSGDTRVPLGFPAASPPTAAAAPEVTAVRRRPDGTVTVVFSRPVMNVTGLTLRLHTSGCSRPGAPLQGRLAANPAGDRWTFTPAGPVQAGAERCLALSPEIYDLAGRGLAGPYRVGVK